MKEISYDNGNIRISDTSLYFYGIDISLNAIESVRVVPREKRSIFFGIKEWFYGFIVVMIIYNVIWKNSFTLIIGDLYIFLLPVILILNIYQYIRKDYVLLVKMMSGEEHKTISRDKLALDKIKDDITERKSLLSSKKDANIVVNNGIISSGNNNKNKVGSKKKK